MAAHPAKRHYSDSDVFTLASLRITIPVSEVYRRLSIPIPRRTSLPLEIVEPVDEQSDEENEEI